MITKDAPSRYLAILDVGHGGCCVLKDEQGTLVVDTGLGTSLEEFLIERGISRLDVVLLSHADQDHISGLTFLLASGLVSIGRVRVNTDSAKKSHLWKNLVYELDRQEASSNLSWNVQLTANSGEDLSVGHVVVDVIAPGKALAALGPGNTTPDGKKITTNTISCVVRLSEGGNGLAVLPGDLDEVGLADLQRQLDGKDASAAILVYPHHGGLSGSGGTAELAVAVCELFKPRTVIFSIGRGKHGTPRPEVVDSVRRKVQSVRIACTQLSEHCCSVVPTEDPAHLLPLYSDGRNDRKCCAGTMLVDLDSGGRLSPDLDEHQTFVKRHAGDALCLRSLS